MSWFALLPIIVFGPGVLVTLTLAAHYYRESRRYRRDRDRLADLAREAHAQRAIAGPNVIPIWWAPSVRREVTDR